MHFSIDSFFSYNLHLGHSLISTLLLAAWSLFGFRRNIWFINLLKTVYLLRVALKLISFVVSNYFPIWFIHLNKFLKSYIDSLALRACEFSCTSLWIRGMLSNFKQVIHTYTILSTKFVSKLTQKLKKFRFNFRNFFVSRFMWPRCLFILSAFANKSILREAYNFRVPCLAIVDTNVSSQGLSLPLPGMMILLML